MDCTQIGVLKETSQVSLGTFLESENCRPLKSKVTLEILGNLANKTLEGELADEKVGGLLVPADLSEGDSAGAVAMGLLHSASGRS